jgi:hypothetical protein
VRADGRQRRQPALTAPAGLSADLKPFGDELVPEAVVDEDLLARK